MSRHYFKPRKRPTLIQRYNKWRREQPSKLKRAANCISYASAQTKHVVNVWDDWQRYSEGQL